MRNKKARITRQQGHVLRKALLRRFHHCVNITENNYTNPDGIGQSLEVAT